MQRVLSGLLLVVGLVNFLPIAGLRSASTLADAYGITVPDGDLLILMRHRALLFGILGAIIIASAFRRHLQPTAITAGLLSMLGFIVLALAAGEHGAKIHTVVLVDAGASALLVAAAFLRARDARRAADR